ncbi:GOLPH3/VPS74 family protein [Nonomuraea longicatena]|uniref:GPP34 family phosphoprotein n=1 Tax=Nonomuraea longicatena TaxID=83682 RepID=A0ABN1R7V1_9ACTN
MNVTIAEEVLLIAHTDQEGKSLVSTTQLGLTLAGAVLAELALNGRVELSKKRVTLKDRSPLGDPELDAVLGRVAEDGKDRTPSSWVQKIQSDKLRTRLLTRLADAGVLTEQSGKVLGIFPTTRWPEADGSIEAEVRARVGDALDGAEPSPRTAVLISLLHSTGLIRKAFPGAAKRRVKEIVEGEWAGEAVAKTIAGINAAVIVTVTTVTTATT